MTSEENKVATEPVDNPAATNQLLQQLIQLMGQQQESLNRQQQAQTEILQAVVQTAQTGNQASHQPAASINVQSPHGQAQKIPEPNRPQLLDANVTLEGFDCWRATWNDYSKCYRFADLPNDHQMARLRTFLSNEMRCELVHGVGINDTDDITPDQALDKIRTYIRARRNVAIDRVAFGERFQDDGEKFDDFYIGLRKIAKNADLCEHCYDTRLATQIMVGVKDKDTKTKLLAMKPFPSLEQVVSTCRSEESGKDNEAALEKRHKEPPRVMKVEQRSPRRPDEKAGQSKEQQNCWFCGYAQHPRSKCPASEASCNNCGLKGHFARMCRKPKKENPPRTEERKITSVLVNGATSTAETHKAPQIYPSIYDRSSNLIGFHKATPDSAAEATVAGTDAMKSLKIDKANLCPVNDGSLQAANGQPLNCLGTAMLTFKYGDRLVTDRVFFCEGTSGILLSWFTCKKLAILPPTYPEPCRSVQAVVNEEPVSTHEIYKILGHVPADPSNEKIRQVKDAILQHFNDVFDDSEELKPMKCKPMTIDLKEEPVPYAVKGARQIPYAWRDKVLAELKKLENQNIIERIPDGDSSEWCHPLVCVPKKDKDEPRVCVDLTRLNSYVIRPFHPFPAAKEAISNIPVGCKYFSVMDARKGYFQIELDAASRHLTTFITPWGRYRFLRAPMGLCSTGDEFCKHGDRALEGIKNLAKVVDDIITYDRDFCEHVQRVWKVLERCRSNNITLDPSKFRFAEAEAKFCGYEISSEGITPNADRLKAISEFPTPRNLSELRSFLGLVKQLYQFSASTSKLAEPLRPLLSPKNVFRWLPEHEDAFEQIKKHLQKPPILATYEVGLETRLYTDASCTNGLGFLLLQKHPNCWRLVECGSRFLSDTEGRYATIELELLAVVWALTKCQLFLRGTTFELICDNKPLVSILNNLTLDQIVSPRLQRLKEKTNGYNFTARWLKGKENVIADAFSRSPTETPTDEEVDFARQIHAVTQTRICNAVSELSDDQTSATLEKLKDSGSKDAKYQSLSEAIQKGFSYYNRTDNYLCRFQKMQKDLSVEDGIILLGQRIVVPESMKREVLKDLHCAHQGAEKTKQRARRCVYWPSINQDIEHMVKTCEKCQITMPSQTKEPLVSDPQPEWVFQEVGMDLFTYAGHQYLVYVDRLSGWPVVCDYGTNVPNSKQVIKTLRQYFSDLGVPEKIRSDNGPQFNCREFEVFTRKWGILHAKSSPRYPQSNGLAESAVKAVKRIVEKTTSNGVLNDDEFVKGMLEYRNSPRYDGISPAEVVFGHALKSHIPAHRRQFANRWKDIEEATNRRASLLEKRDEQYNRNAHCLKKLKIGDTVRIQDENTKKWLAVGIISGTHKNRSYLVRLPGGRILWRNRRFLRLIDDRNQTTEDGDTGEEDEATSEPEPRRSTRTRHSPERWAYQ